MITPIAVDNISKVQPNILDLQLNTNPENAKVFQLNHKTIIIFVRKTNKSKKCTHTNNERGINNERVELLASMLNVTDSHIQIENDLAHIFTRFF